jgi:hypothetical protein
MKRAILAAAFALAIAACGLRAPLQPAPGHAMPMAPPMASRPLTTDELLAPPPIARPDRTDESLRRSQEREDDRFELPPGDVPVSSNQTADDPE